MWRAPQLEYKGLKALQDINSMTGDELYCSWIVKSYLKMKPFPCFWQSLNLSWSILLTCDPNDFTLEDNHASVTNDVVSCLESFCNKEQLPIFFMCRWLKTLCKAEINDSQMWHNVTLTCKKKRNLKKARKML